MAKYKKKTTRRKPAENRCVPITRTFSFSLPVYFKAQFSFCESEVDDPEDDDPEITEEAIRTLEQELQKYLAKKYSVDRLEIIDDGFDSVYLGEL